MSNQKENDRDNSREESLRVALQQNREHATFEEKQRATLSVPNILSFSRFLILAPIVFAILNNHIFFASFWVLLSYLTDVADGIIARRLNQESEFGRILDSSADKLTLVVVLGCLAEIGRFPVWALILVVGREVIIVGTSLWIILMDKNVIAPSIYGKITGLVFIIMEIAYIIDSYPLNVITLCVALVLMSVAFAKYIDQLMKLKRS